MFFFGLFIRGGGAKIFFCLSFLLPPQQSCGKVMFLHLSVSHSVHGVGGGIWGLCPNMHHRSHNQKGGLFPGGSLSGGSLSNGSLSRGVSVWGISVQGRFLSSGVSFQRGLCPGLSLPRGSLPRGVSAQGVSVQGGYLLGNLCPGGLCLGVSVQGGSMLRTPVTSGRYTSYWNAYLFDIF